MNFDQRKSEAESLVVEFLGDYVPPRGLSDASLAQRIRFIADSFARKMPTSGDYAEAVKTVLLKIRDTHESNTWPTQPVFIMAMPAGDRPQFAQLQQFAPDRVKVLIERMEAGEGVPEAAIWGPISSQLTLPAGVLEGYRNSSVASWREVYRRDALELMRAQYGDVVAMYFPQQTAAQ